MIIGSHVSMKAPHYVLGSVLEMLSYEANAMMIYTGPPQNTRRAQLDRLKIKEAKELMNEKHVPMDNIVVHAPYLINLANTFRQETFDLSVELLQSEIMRTQEIGAHLLVLHPGSHVNAGANRGIESIIHGLNLAMSEEQEVIVCLETMAGKGSECGRSFEEIKQMIDGCRYPSKLGVCLDTCHIHDAGYDLNDFDAVLDEFDRVIGLDYLKVIHLNDSKNIKGAQKDRHENLGYGSIGFENLVRIAHHPRIAHIPKILETPYIEDKAPYKEEIMMLRNQTFMNIKQQD